MKVLAGFEMGICFIEMLQNIPCGLAIKLAVQRPIAMKV